MTREIKFRAWTGMTMFTYKTLEGFFAHAELHEWPFMQFTGLKDKNGVDVFEGDIIRLHWPNGKFSDSKIIWDFGSWQIKGFGLLANAKDEWLEIIGNIYENPDLLLDTQK